MWYFAIGSFWVDYTAFGVVIFLWSFCILLLPRKMQISGATDLASKGQAVSDSSNVKVKAEVEESFQIQSATKIRCLCGSTLETEDLIKVKHSNMFLRSLWSIKFYATVHAYISLLIINEREKVRRYEKHMHKSCVSNTPRMFHYIG
jgi:hypothetical protein